MADQKQDAHRAGTDKVRGIGRRLFLFSLGSAIVGANILLLVRMKRQGPKDVVIVDGPFTSGDRKNIPTPQVPTKFVKPISLAIKERGTLCTARVNFEFLGSTQQLRLVFEARNDQGQVVARKEQICARQQVSQEPVYVSGYPVFSRDTCNSENFNIPLSGALEDISDVQVSFSPIF